MENNIINLKDGYGYPYHHLNATIFNVKTEWDPRTYFQGVPLCDYWILPSNNLVLIDNMTVDHIRNVVKYLQRTWSKKIRGRTGKRLVKAACEGPIYLNPHIVMGTKLEQYMSDLAHLGHINRCLAAAEVNKLIQTGLDNLEFLNLDSRYKSLIIAMNDHLDKGAYDVIV